MRVSEHLLDTPPRPRIQLIESLDRPAVLVELRATEFGPAYALSAEDPQHMYLLAEAFTAAAVALESAQIGRAQNDGATWNHLDVA
jgi:hypothetical protein